MTPSATRSVPPLASGGHKAWLTDSNYTVNFDKGTSTQGMWSSGTGINAYWADTTEIWAKSIRFLKVTEDLTKNEPPGSTNRVKTPALFTRFSLSSLSILLCRPRYIFFKQTVMDSHHNVLYVFSNLCEQGGEIKRRSTPRPEKACGRQT